MGRLDTADVLTRVFELYRRAAGMLLPAAAVIYLAVALITAAALSGDTSQLLLLLSALLGVVATFWYQALVVEIVREYRTSGTLRSPREIVDLVRPRLGAVLGVGLLAGLGIAAGFVLLIVPGLYLLTIWSLIIPVLIVERGPAMEAFARSRYLVRGTAWQVFSILVVIYLITFVIQQVFRAAGGTTFVGLFVTSYIPSVLVAPLGALTASTMYFDLRSLKGESAPAPPPV
jgi:hypothetical protein